ncbi:MAG: DUF5683 domain-containing protein [Cytophagaceae bacterium]
MFRYLLLLFFSLTIASATQAQDKPTKEEQKKIRRLNSKSRKAAILSALAPGAGQLYNKKYWKAPIVWIGLGATGYLYYKNSTSFHAFKDEYHKVSGNSGYISDTIINGYHTFGRSADQLARERDSYRYYRDLDLLIGLGIYALNIVDASVDAHLKEFDINDNLSLKVKPLLYANLNRQFTAGLTLNFRFKK